MERKQNRKIAALIAGALFAVSGLTGVANATRIGCGNSFTAYGAAAEEAATLQDKNLAIANSTSFDGVRVSITGQVESDAAAEAYARRTVLYAGIGEGDRDLSEAEQAAILASADHILRKCTHFCVYAALGALLLLDSLCFAAKPPVHILRALFAAALYAASDEIHQSFVPGRGPAVTDVLLDSAGALCGILFIWLLVQAVLRRRGK